MSKEFITFDDIEIGKQKFHCPKSPINWFSFGKKSFDYFIDYKNNKRIRSLCLMLLKVSAYRRNFHESRYMAF